MLPSFISTLILSVAATTSSAQTFKEDFSKGLASDRWKVSTWTAPRHSLINAASFSASNVEVVNGVLRLKLTQTRNADGSISSIGGELMSIKKFGYGTYTLVMKSSADKNNEAVSGSITGAGLYLSISETEIDIEMEGYWPRANLTQLATWVDETTVQKTLVAKDLPYKDFHTYKIVWAPAAIQFFVDESLIATHKNVVPKAAASFLLNHWGTNDSSWGGMATPNVDRYVYIKSFTFTQLNLNK